MAPIIYRNIGGSANVSVDATEFGLYQLTGLDSNGQVVTDLNVTLKAGTSPVDPLTIRLPEISSLNNRKVRVTIFTGDFENELLIQSYLGDFINNLSVTELSNTTKKIALVFEVSTNFTWSNFVNS